MKALELTGKVFGRLTAVSRIDGSKPIRWLCQCDCGNTANVSVSNLTKGALGTKSCGCIIASDIKILVGNKYSTQSSGEVTVISRCKGDYVLISFEDGTQIEVTQGNLRKGNIRNPNLKVTHGVGYQGIGPYSQHGTKAHEYWSKMLQRAYCPRYKEDHPTYECVSVVDEWHNFQNFAAWCESQPNYGKFGLNLDKDIIVKGNKVYGPDYCCLLPQQVNKLLGQKSIVRDLPPGVVKEGKKYIARCRVNSKECYLGIFETSREAGDAYVKAKETEIKRVANKFKDQIDPRAYESLMKYTIG